MTKCGLQVQALSGMTEDCKRHFRQKVRDILVKLVRKFSIETVLSFIPTSDEMMHKRLKNIRKIEARKQKDKESRKVKEAEDNDDTFNIKRSPKSLDEILADSDEEFEDVETEDNEKSRKKSARKKTWITEGGDNIVDFVDPTTARSITGELYSYSVINMRRERIF